MIPRRKFRFADQNLSGKHWSSNNDFIKYVSCFFQDMKVFPQNRWTSNQTLNQLMPLVVSSRFLGQTYLFINPREKRRKLAMAWQFLVTTHSLIYLLMNLASFFKKLIASNGRKTIIEYVGVIPSSVPSFAMFVFMILMSFRHAKLWKLLQQNERELLLMKKEMKRFPGFLLRRWAVVFQVFLVYFSSMYMVFVNFMQFNEVTDFSSVSNVLNLANEVLFHVFVVGSYKSVEILYGLACVLLAQKVRAFNDFLRTEVRQWQTINVTAEILKMHDEVADAITSVDSCFSFFVICDATGIIVFICVILFSVNLENCALLLLTFILIMLSPLLQYYLSTIILRESECTLRLLHSLGIDPQIASRFQSNQLMLLISKLTRPLSMSAGGLFVMSNRFLLSMFTTILTYMILLHQLNNS